MNGNISLLLINLKIPFSMASQYSITWMQHKLFALSICLSLKFSLTFLAFVLKSWYNTCLPRSASLKTLYYRGTLVFCMWQEKTSLGKTSCEQSNTVVKISWQAEFTLSMHSFWKRLVFLHSVCSTQVLASNVLP